VTVQPHGISELPGAIVTTEQAMRFGGVILVYIRELGHLLNIPVLMVVPLLLVWLFGS